ncbi:MAG: YybH family protein [Bacteroidota bacterium]
MRKVIHLFVLSLVVLLVVACQPPQDVEREIAALKEGETGYVEAFQNEDVDAIMETYWNSPDLIRYTVATMEVRGYDTVQQRYAQFFEGGDVKSFEILDSQYKVSGDLAVGWSRWKLTYQPTDGPEWQREGRWTGMFTKQGGKWYITVDHASAPLTAPSPMAIEAE